MIRKLLRRKFGRSRASLQGAHVPAERSDPQASDPEEGHQISQTPHLDDLEEALRVLDDRN